MASSKKFSIPKKKYEVPDLGDLEVLPGIENVPKKVEVPHKELKERIYIANLTAFSYSCSIPGLGLISIKPGRTEFPNIQIADKVLQEFNKVFSGESFRPLQIIKLKE